MASEFKIQGEVEVDATQAIDSLGEVVKEAGPELQGALDKSAKKFKSMGSAAKKGAATAAKGLAGAGALALAAGAAVLNLSKAFTELSNKQATAQALGGTRVAAEGIKAALDNTITSMEALTLSSQLFLRGFKTSDAQKEMALFLKGMAGANGETIEATMGMLEAGEAGTNMGLKFKSLTGAIQAARSEWMALRGGVEPLPGEMLKIAAGAARATQGVMPFLKTMNKLNQPNMLDQLMASLRELRDEFVIKVGPAVKRFVKDFKKGLPELKGAIERSGLVRFLSATNSLLNAAVKSWDNWAGAFKRAKTAIMGSNKAKDEALKKDKQWRAALESQLKATSRNANALAKLDVLRETAAQKRAKRIKRIGNLIRQERADEITGLQAATRAEGRAPTAGIVQAMGGLGGTWAGILASQIDFFEKSRQFKTVYKDIGKHANLTFKEIASNTMGVSKTQAALAFRLKLYQKAGMMDAKEKFLMETNVNNQLLGALETSAAQAQITTMEVERNIAIIDLKLAMWQVDKLILGAKIRGNIQDKKQIATWVKYRTNIEAIAKQRAANIALVIKVMEVEKQAEQMRAKAQLAERERGMVTANITLAHQLQNLQHGKAMITTQERIRTEGRAHVATIMAAQKGLMMELDILNKLDEAGKFRTADQQKAAALQIDSLTAQIALKKEELGLSRQIIDAQVQQSTVFGSFMESAKGQFADLSQKAGQAWAGAFQSLVGGVGSMISGTMETLVSGVGNAGEAAGKLFLDVLAGAAAQLGAFYMAAGAAQMWVPPYTGAGAMIGGAALLALSGLLKGAGSLIGAPAKTTTTSGGGAKIPSSPTPSTLPGQTTPRDMRPVQFMFSVSQEPWGAPSDQERFNNLKRWSERMGRSTGIRDPFAAAQAMGGRR